MFAALGRLSVDVVVEPAPQWLQPDRVNECECIVINVQGRMLVVLR